MHHTLTTGPLSWSGTSESFYERERVMADKAVPVCPQVGMLSISGMAYQIENFDHFFGYEVNINVCPWSRLSSAST